MMDVGSENKISIIVKDGYSHVEDRFQDSFSVEEINNEFALVLMGKDAVVMRYNLDKVLEDSSRILSISAFQTWLGNRFVTEMTANGRERKTSFANYWLSHPQRLQYEGVHFYPDPNNENSCKKYLNLWKGFSYTPKNKPKGYATFQDHILTNVCNGDPKLYKWVFGFFAHIVQKPRERVGVAMILRGKMGCGKTILGETFGALFREHFFLVDDPRYVTGNFNSHMSACLLLQADEAVWAGDKEAEGRLKGMVTSSVQMIEHKGVDPQARKNYVRLIMTSNESWVVPAGADERRFCVLDVSPHCVGNKDYFQAIKDELNNGGYEALLHDLLEFDLSSIDLRTIPKTEALLEQKERSLNSISAWWLERLLSGTLSLKHDQWVNRIFKEELHSEYIAMCEKIGIKRKQEFVVFCREMHELVPGLKDARFFDAEGRRLRVFKFPSLEECRADWDERMNQQRKWVDDEEEAA